MKIHEYQAKAILARHGVPVPRGEVASNASEAAEIARRLGTSVVVVKAQIHAGGRGKGGGVKLAKSPEQAEKIASSMIGMTLVTHQTGPEGRVVGRVLVEEGLQMDARALSEHRARSRGRPAGHHGERRRRHGHRGKVAEKTPEKIVRVYIDPGVGIVPFEARSSASASASTARRSTSSSRWCRRSTTLSRHRLVAARNQPAWSSPRAAISSRLDAKMNFDDNALYRHTDIRDPARPRRRGSARDRSVQVLAELHPSRRHIGCMVNGAGLAMATMDIIKLAGGEPANFLDVGGGANAEQIRNAFKILMSDANVKAVLINIFGGILRCDILAQGVIAAVKELGVPVPIVIRMEGTNVDEGKRLLKESGMQLTTADSMDEAAKKVVELAG
jgi:succinyl-CoA synthetase beta subunit